MRPTWRDCVVAAFLWALPAASAWPELNLSFDPSRVGIPGVQTTRTVATYVPEARTIPEVPPLAEARPNYAAPPEVKPAITQPTIYSTVEQPVYLDRGLVGKDLTAEGQGLVVPAGARLELDPSAKPTDPWVKVKVPGYQGAGGSDLTGWVNASSLQRTNDGLPTPAETTADPKSNKSASAFVQKAREQKGKPYKWGAQGPGAFDCSGLVDYAKKVAGLPGNLPRTAKEQAQAVNAHPVTDAEISKLKPGTLIFFDKGEGVHHVIIKAEGNNVIEAPNSGSTVTEGPYRPRPGEKVTAGEIKGA